MQARGDSAPELARVRRVIEARANDVQEPLAEHVLRLARVAGRVAALQDDGRVVLAPNAAVQHRVEE